MGGRRWTGAEISYLRDNVKRFTFEYIGKRLKRSTTSVASMSVRLGFNKYWSDSETEALRKLAGKGLTCTAIAEKLGFDPQTVRANARRYGITLKRPIKHSDESVRRCHQLHQQGVGRRDIAEATGIPLGTVSNYLDGLYRTTALKG